MKELKFCYTCEHWHTTKIWRGNCKKHPWDKNKYSQEAHVSDCPDYVDKNAKYQVVEGAKMKGEIEEIIRDCISCDYDHNLVGVDDAVKGILSLLHPKENVVGSVGL